MIMCKKSVIILDNKHNVLSLCFDKSGDEIIQELINVKKKISQTYNEETELLIAEISSITKIKIQKNQ